jgi:hypothetical protein
MVAKKRIRADAFETDAATVLVELVCAQRSPTALADIELPRDRAGRRDDGTLV